MRFKLIAFDLDGVLVEESSAWWTLHKAFGTYEVSRKNLRLYEAGKIDYPEFMRRDIRLWGKRNIKEVETILHKYTLTEGSSKTCNTLHQQGYQLAIVSAGIDMLARAVSGKLGIKHWVANGLEVDNQGFLTGEGVFRVDLMKKHVALKELISPLGITLLQTVAVGDSKYDIPFIRSCGAGIAFARGGICTECNPCVESCKKIISLKDFPQALSELKNSRTHYT
jgi:HAD superfamily PSPase-like hydrolase